MSPQCGSYACFNGKWNDLVGTNSGRTGNQDQSTAVEQPFICQVRDPTTWAIIRHNGPNPLGL